MRLPIALPRTGGEYDGWASIIEADEAIKSVTAAYTATALDHTILANAAGGAFTVTLPKAADNKGKILCVKRTNSGANAVTIARQGSDTIDGAATVTLSAQYASRLLQSDGSNWIILASI